MLDISDYLKSKTGFTLAPVAGLLDSRYFMNALAFRVFNSTQYIRHSNAPDYTPEPDIVHELVGHVPLLANPDFAEFTQTLGLASLGASDEDVSRLARCYWFTVEFGLTKQLDANGKPCTRAVGAGLLSSFGELKYCLSDKPELKPFDPAVAGITEYPITTFQPLYFVSDSFKDMTEKMRAFSETMDRPYGIKFDFDKWEVQKIEK